jgi:hypothetical protein
MGEWRRNSTDSGLPEGISIVLAWPGKEPARKMAAGSKAKNRAVKCSQKQLCCPERFMVLKLLLTMLKSQCTEMVDEAKALLLKEKTKRLVLS